LKEFKTNRTVVAGSFEYYKWNHYNHTVKPGRIAMDPLDLNLSWLVDHEDNVFTIDRSLRFTPTRNPAVVAATDFAKELISWIDKILSFCARASNDYSYVNYVGSESTFCLAPVVVNGKPLETNLLKQQFDQAVATLLAKGAPAELIMDFNFVVRLKVVRAIAVSYGEENWCLLFFSKTCKKKTKPVNSICYLEELLLNSLVAVVGKHVSQSDIEEYMVCSFFFFFWEFFTTKK
jgi:hypothetical protein